MLRKYTQELHANELVPMGYYIAAINIEATLHGLLRDQAIAAGTNPDAAGYEPFDGIVLTDTFRMTEDGDTLYEHVFTNNSDRVIKQNALDIRVIIGNPPYFLGQTSGNDYNANLKYPTLDESIRRTYVERSTATNKNSLDDSCIRANDAHVALQDIGFHPLHLFGDRPSVCSHAGPLQPITEPLGFPLGRCSYQVSPAHCELGRDSTWHSLSRP